MTRYRSATTTRARLHGLASALACLILLVAVQAAAKDISVNEAAGLLQNPPQGLTIVDVRTPAEFREGHLAGAVNMDFFGASFDSQILALPKDKPILLYCRTGNRSAGAYDAMEKEGITNILHMNQGVTAWQQAGLPLQK
ncbi:rhodanese-like domain-containing protein [Desulfovibrio desulfuricans]|uniref:Rhodanese-like domain-containing protein n=1 Tax=Desulfovibrio desulfuricans TaxID=876 RepID=A0A4P7UF38_DESDE|nr:rhodanese-like domain-containing protein [Desulfovibrio desulfuricans]QCC84495.1 rhodanese-like domain-containing protein [Desulfovibrio desulfuricans]